MALNIPSVCQARACAWAARVAVPWPARDGAWDPRIFF